MKDSQALNTKLNNLPKGSGVYLMKNRSGKVIYVGKAKSLRNRIRSYFRRGRHIDPKTEALVSKIADFEVLLTDSEIEALLLEANLIKEYKPRYNVDLKDDKKYPYIKITLDEDFPRVLITRRLEKDGSKYFGPYTDVKKMRATVKLLNDIFPIRSCKVFPGENAAENPCLNFQIGRCFAPCVGGISKAEYMLMIDNIIKFLCGKTREVVQSIKRQMKSYSAELKFESAARCRDQIKGIEKVIQKQKMVNTDRVDRDYIGSAEVGNDGCFSVLQVRDGILLGRQHYYYRLGNEPSGEFIKNFILNYYRNVAVYPSEILIGGEIADRELIEDWLKENAGHKVEIISPQKGSKVNLLNLAESNAMLLLDELLLQKQSSKKKIPHSIFELQKILNLKSPPRKISAFDISNFGESEAVGSMVFFKDGKPKKGNYRRFKIKSVERQDDFAMMSEVVGRYLRRTVDGIEELPDLILIDGGKGQLGSALQVLRSLKLNIPTISLAKRIDEIFVPERRESIIISHSSTALQLLQRVRDEAHRFAIEYHRKLRGRKSIASELDKISGIGEIRKYRLLIHFGSVKAIKEAPFSEIITCPGIPKNVASAVFNYFHSEGEKITIGKD